MKNVDKGDPPHVRWVAEWINGLPEKDSELTQDQIRMVWYALPDVLALRDHPNMGRSEITFCWMMGSLYKGFGLAQCRLYKTETRYGVGESTVRGEATALRNCLQTLDLDNLRREEYMSANWGNPVLERTNEAMKGLMRNFQGYVRHRIPLGIKPRLDRFLHDLESLVGRDAEALKRYILWLGEGGTMRLRDGLLREVGFDFNNDEHYDAFTTLDSLGLHFREEVLKDGSR